MSTNSYSDMELSEVYNPIRFLTEKGEEIVLVMRDAGYESGIRNQSNTFQMYIVQNGQIKEVTEDANGVK